MSTVIDVIFDGEVLRPQMPLHLTPNAHYSVIVNDAATWPEPAVDAGIPKRDPERQALSDKNQLLDQYHELVGVERHNGLSFAQTARLKEVERQLDEIEAQNPMVQAFYRRLDEDDNKLDEILAMLKDRSAKQ